VPYVPLAISEGTSVQGEQEGDSWGLLVMYNPLPTSRWPKPHNVDLEPNVVAAYTSGVVLLLQPQGYDDMFLFCTLLKALYHNFFMLLNLSGDFGLLTTV
jgi:hypothetical protein